MLNTPPKYPSTVALEAGGTFHVVFPGLPGCMSGAEDWDDLIPNAEEAPALWLETAKELGRPIPPPTIGDPCDALPWRDSLDRDPTPALSARDVAAKLGVNPRRVQALARARGIGRKIGNSLTFADADVAKLTPERPGRPRRPPARPS